jgi:hypothetical protein
MAANTGIGCVQGQVVLRVPMGDLTDPTRYVTLPLPDVKVELTPRGATSTAKASSQLTGADGTFCFDGLTPGTHMVWYPKQTDRGGTTFPAVSTDMIVEVEAPYGSSCAAGDCGWAATFEYVVDANLQATAAAASAQAIQTAVESTAAETANIANTLSAASGAVAARQARIDNATAAVTGMKGTLDTTATDINQIARTLRGASNDVKTSPYLTSTLDAIQDIRTALRDMATFPYSGPSDTNGHQPPARSSRTPVAASSSIRGGVQAALDDLGLSDTMTDADLARLFPAETDDDGETTYRWAGPAIASRASIRSNGTGRAGDVAISGSLARFQQQAQAALREVSEAFAIVKPLNGDAADDATIATQKAIVLDTIRQIVAEPGRPDGLRPIAIDAHFDSLLKDKVLVSSKTGGAPAKKKGSLKALKYMLGITTAAITDQTTEVHVTEWKRVEDAVGSLRSAWNSFRGTKKLRRALRRGRQRTEHAENRALHEPGAGRNPVSSPRWRNRHDR